MLTLLILCVVVILVSNGASFSLYASRLSSARTSFLVADTGNNRVLWVIAGQVARNLSTPLASPTGVALTYEGVAVICDTGNHRLYLSRPGGSALVAFGSFGSGLNQFNTPANAPPDKSIIKISKPMAGGGDATVFATQAQIIASPLVRDLNNMPITAIGFVSNAGILALGNNDVLLSDATSRNVIRIKQ